MVHQNSCRFYENVAYDPQFNGLVLDDKEGERLAKVPRVRATLAARAARAGVTALPPHAPPPARAPR